MGIDKPRSDQQMFSCRFLILGQKEAKEFKELFRDFNRINTLMVWVKSKKRNGAPALFQQQTFFQVLLIRLVKESVVRLVVVYNSKLAELVLSFQL